MNAPRIYIYIYMYQGHSINNVNFAEAFFSRKHCLQEINCDESFLTSEDSQHDLLYWLLHQERFLFTRVSTPLMVNSTLARHGKPRFIPFENILLFYKNMLLRTNKTFLYKVHMVCTSQPAKVRWQTSVQAWALWFDVILNSLKTKTFVWSKWFWQQTNFKQYNLHFRKKYPKKIYFVFLKKSVYLLYDPLAFLLIKRSCPVWRGGGVKTSKTRIFDLPRKIWTIKPKII